MLYIILYITLYYIVLCYTIVLLFYITISVLYNTCSVINYYNISFVKAPTMIPIENKVLNILSNKLY